MSEPPMKGADSMVSAEYPNKAGPDMKGSAVSASIESAPVVIREECLPDCPNCARMMMERDSLIFERDGVEQNRLRDNAYLIARAEKSETALEALRTRLRGLEQQWRERGMICCPETKQPRAGWSQQEYVERLGGAILLQHADELARLLTTPEEP